MENGLGSYLRSIEDQEAAGEAACYEAATKAGISLMQAEICDDREWGCPECPWKPKA